MSKLLKEIPLGDFVVSLRELNNGHLQAKLSSASHGPLIEVEKLSDDGKLRVRELEFGSATVTVEHFAILFTLVGVADDLVTEINQIKHLINHED